MLVRTERDVSVHPSTRLPGTTEIERDMRRRLDSGEEFAVCYADLDHFKEFNDRYSYYDGDRVIYMLSRILHDVVKGLLGPRGFVGHIGGDDFIFVPATEISPVCSEILEVFDTLIPLQYNEQDRRAGYFFGKDRRGQLHRVPLMTLSIGIVTNRHRQVHPSGPGERACHRNEELRQDPARLGVRRGSAPRATGGRGGRDERLVSQLRHGVPRGSGQGSAGGGPRALPGLRGRLSGRRAAEVAELPAVRRRCRRPMAPPGTDRQPPPSRLRRPPMPASGPRPRRRRPRCAPRRSRRRRAATPGDARSQHRGARPSPPAAPVVPRLRRWSKAARSAAASSRSPPPRAPPPRRRPVANPFLSQDPRQSAPAGAGARLRYGGVPSRQAPGSARPGTLKQEFEEEIRKSWEEYADQVGKDMADVDAYFNDALNEILAGGQQIF